jgi:NhaA family Na+:H+ antiporter
MNQHPSRQDRAAGAAFDRTRFRHARTFLHIEAVSGSRAVVAAAIALIWANSSLADSHHHLWHTPLSFGLGGFVFSQSLHFWINDALMTVFFLVVGMEIRREMHEGALEQPAASQPAHRGGPRRRVVPALIYLALNGDAVRKHGWAVPTATDIAFAVGVLALLGRLDPWQCAGLPTRAGHHRRHHRGAHHRAVLLGRA